MTTPNSIPLLPKSVLALIEQDGAEAVLIESADALPAAPAVSVLMLAYNHAPYIAQAIESVISQQSVFPFELLIAEDCSPDNTLSVGRRYQQLYPNIIRIVTGPTNVGMRRNEFRAMAKARGGFYAFCEGDDWWADKSKLQRQYDTMAANPESAMCFHTVQRFDQKTGHYGGLIGLGRKAQNLRVRDAIANYGNCIQTCSMFLRRSAYPPMEEWCLNAPVGDYPMKLWAGCSGTCHYDPRIMGIYRKGVEASWSGSKRNPDQTLEIRRRTIELLLAIKSKFDLVGAGRAVDNQIGQILRDYLLEYPEISMEALNKPDSYGAYLRPIDRLLVKASRLLGISRQARSSIERLVTFHNRMKFLGFRRH